MRCSPTAPMRTTAIWCRARKPGAVLHDAKEIAERVVRMVQDGAVVSVTGKVIKMRTDTVCIHGDNPSAVEIARGVRKALKDSGIDVAPFKRRHRTDAPKRAEHHGGDDRKGAVKRRQVKAGARPPERPRIQMQAGFRR